MLPRGASELLQISISGSCGRTAEATGTGQQRMRRLDMSGRQRGLVFELKLQDPAEAESGGCTYDVFPVGVRDGSDSDLDSTALAAACLSGV